MNGYAIIKAVILSINMIHQNLINKIVKNVNNKI
jgi:hypothetical protein